MLAPKDDGMSAEAFLEWASRQDGRYELVNGDPIEMMVGAKQSHNVVVKNLVVALDMSAKKGGCRTTSSDTAVICGHNQVRYPDLVVDCGPSDPDALAATKPVILAEVLSKSTSQIDLTNKLDEYQSIASVEAILFIEPDIISVKLYRRDATGAWQPERFSSLEERIELPAIKATLSLADIYDTLDPRPDIEIRPVGVRTERG